MRVTGLANSSSSLIVPWTSQAEIVTACRSGSGTTGRRSVVSSLRVLRCWLCEATARTLVLMLPGQARPPTFASARLQAHNSSPELVFENILLPPSGSSFT
jgi:hypothetical protein